MLNFKEELSKYKPLLELDDIEEALGKSEIKDLMDVLQHLALQSKTKEE